MIVVPGAIGDITAVVAGDGLSGGATEGSATVTLDLNELTAAVVAVASDSIAIIDADDDGSKKESVADFVSGIAGTNISAGSGQLSVADSAGGTKGIVIVAGNAPASIGYSSGTATISIADSASGTKGAVIVAGNAPASIGYSSGTATISIADSAASTKGAVIVAGGDGIAVSYSSGTATVAADLGTNPGLEIDSNKLQIAKGISQHDVAQFTSGVVDDDFLRIDGTVVEGRSASEVLSDISAAPAAGDSNILTTGALDSGSITSGFGAIDNGTSNIRTATFTAETAVVPDAASGATLGTTSLEWGHIYVGDDQKLYLGDAQDVSLEYDEDGTDQLRISGKTVFDNDMEVADSKFIEFASTAGTPTTDNTVQGVVIEFLAVEAITQFDAVYVSTTTGRVGRADANDAAKLPAIGIAIEAQGSAGSSVRVLTHGVYRDDGGFGGNRTVGEDLYVSETPGTLTATAPGDDGDFVQLMGVAIGVRSAFINPDLTIIEVA